jgi:hypothetical protein
MTIFLCIMTSGTLFCNEDFLCGRIHRWMNVLITRCIWMWVYHVYLFLIPCLIFWSCFWYMNLNVFDISGNPFYCWWRTFVWSMFCCVRYVQRKYAVLLYFLLPAVLPVLVVVGTGKEVMNFYVIELLGFVNSWQ